MPDPIWICLDRVIYSCVISLRTLEAIDHRSGTHDPNIYSPFGFNVLELIEPDNN
jgi:hypothetical protein